MTGQEDGTMLSCASVALAAETHEIGEFADLSCLHRVKILLLCSCPQRTNMMDAVLTMLRSLWAHGCVLTHYIMTSHMVSRYGCASLDHGMTILAFHHSYPFPYSSSASFSFSSPFPLLRYYLPLAHPHYHCFHFRSALVCQL